MSNGGGSAAGRFVGILVFLGGVALIALTFQQAYHMFNLPAAQTLNVQADAPLNVNETVNRLIQIILRVLLLLVMAAAGSLVANVGIRLFAAPMHGPLDKKKKKKTASPAPEEPTTPPSP